MPCLSKGDKLVSGRSGIFRDGAVERTVGTDLQQIWLDHLLVLSTAGGESPGEAAPRGVSGAVPVEIEPWHVAPEHGNLIQRGCPAFNCQTCEIASIGRRFSA